MTHTEVICNLKEMLEFYRKLQYNNSKRKFSLWDIENTRYIETLKTIIKDYSERNKNVKNS